MRTIIRTMGVAVAACGMVLGVAGATDREEAAPESRAYVGFAFGGQKVAPRAFHYGLRIDHDARFVDGERAPLMQFDFTSRGLSDARLNGLSVLKREYRLRQAEESPPEESTGEAPDEASTEEAPAESAESAEAPAEGGEAAAGEGGGFFSGIGNFFGGLFGGDDDEPAEGEAPAEATAEAAPAEEAPAEASGEPAADGTFLSFGAVDWALLALGAAGVGLAASEVNNGDETPDPQGGAGGGGGSTGGTSGTGCTFIPTTTTCIPTTFAYSPGRYATPFDDRARDPEYQKWLDGGTGQMGDLGGQ